jgi:AcrR family transcriptional regulator
VSRDGVPESSGPGAGARKSLRELQRDLTREHVTRTALEVFDRLGFVTTTMDDIADEAQVNRGTLYLHFSNKADILYAALSGIRGLRENYEAAAGAVTETEVRRVFERTAEYWQSGAAGVWRHIRDAAASDANIRAWQSDYDARQRRVLQRILVGQGVPDAVAAVRSFLLMGMFTELMYQMTMDPDIAEMPGLVDALVGFYLTARRP